MCTRLQIWAPCFHTLAQHHAARQAWGSSIHGKKVCVLEDLRAGTFGLSWDAYLVWWEGLVLQNQHRGPLDYEDQATVFATGGERLKIPLKEALELGVDPTVQNDMMDKRWKYFRFTHTFNGAARRKVKACGCCYGKWLCGRCGRCDGVAVVDYF